VRFKESHLLFVLLVAVGLQVFYLSIVGFTTTPFYDVENEITRCPDWRFHECYASCLVLSECNPSGGYDSYMPLIHLTANVLSSLSSFPPLFWLAVFTSASLCLLTALLFKHSNGLLGGLLAVALFLMVLPLAFILLTGMPLFTWFDLVACGLVTFLVATALFCLLLLEAGNLGFTKSFIVFALIVASHNYGFVLALFALACFTGSFLVEYLTNGKLRLPVTWFAIAGVLTWLAVFSSRYLTYSGERIVFVLYFLLVLELSRFLSQQLQRGGLS